MNKKKHLQAIANRYFEEFGDKPESSRVIADWAIREELWKPRPDQIVTQCAEEISRAMREDYIVDRRGRTVRVKHAAKIFEGGKQITLWADRRTAPRKHMEIALRQRREQIVGDCYQLKIDVDSYNGEYSAAKPIQMRFDFSQDLQELTSLPAA